MADPNWANVGALIGNNNAADGTTVITDQSTSAKSVTTEGATVWDDSTAPTGLTSCLQLDGSLDDAVMATSADFAFGTGDFTVEIRLRFDAWAGNQVFVIVGQSGSSPFQLWRPNGNTLRLLLAGGTVLDPAWTPSINTWYDVGVRRSGTTVQLWVDQVQLGTDATSAANVTQNQCIIGGINWAANYGLQGRFASCRITKGVARDLSVARTLPYPTSDVDPPVADFTGTPTSGTAPLSVAFTDTSTNTPTSWAWTFGDGNTSTSQNPSNNYLSAGTYNVSLTATNAAGSDAETKTGYITVTAAAVSTVTSTGGKGDNAARRQRIFKPTGLDHPRPKLKLKAKDERVQQRLDDSARIQAEVAAELAQELGTEPPPVQRMSQAQIDSEIKTLLHRKIRTENEEIMLLLLLAASA